VAVEVIIQERDAEGEFFSLEEFVARVPKAKVNRSTILNLILAGAFDELYLVQSADQRARIVKEHYRLLKEAIPAPLQAAIDAGNPQWWEMQQRLLVGVGEVSYKDLLRLYPFPVGKPQYRTAGEVQLQGPSGQFSQVAVGGQLLSCVERMSKKGPFGQLTLQCNDDLVLVTLWNEHWAPHKAALEANLNATVYVSGEVVKDDYKKCNVLHSRNFTEIQIINF
jgi:DNA polymerase III alpha subunit